MLPMRLLLPLLVASTTLNLAFSCQTSEGDQNVGVFAFYDETCASGGAGPGCFGNNCRFCSAFDSPESDPFIDCPVSVECVTSEGDLAVGVAAFFDETCLTGGSPDGFLGCFANVCRHCALFSSPQADHLVSCAFGTSAPTTSSEAPSLSPSLSPSDPPSASPVPSSSPSLSPSASPSSSPSSKPSLRPSAKPSAGPSLAPTSSPAPSSSPSLSPSGSPSASPSLSPSDFPSASLAPSSSPSLSPSASPSSSPSSKPSLRPSTKPSLRPSTKPSAGPSPDPNNCSTHPSDEEVGVFGVYDDTCTTGTSPNGKLGCFTPVCRHCKAFDTEQSDHLVECAGYMVTPSASPSSFPSSFPSSSPSSSPSSPPSGSAADCTTSDGDQSVGVFAFYDETCTTGGSADGFLGCFEGVCRHCKESDSQQSQHLVDCP